MNLNELQENSKTKLAQRALKEHYNVKIDLDRLDAKATREMLGKVRSALNEARKEKTLHESHQSPAYLKMLMMEQMLENHFADMNVEPYSIVVENEETQQAKVIVAVSGLSDRLQKMLQQVSKIRVEELAALTDGITNEYGTAEGQTFQQTMNDALSQLEQAISSTKEATDNSIGILTGDSATAPAPAAPEAPVGDELDMSMDTEIAGPDEIEADSEELEIEEPEELGSAGRAKR